MLSHLSGSETQQPPGFFFCRLGKQAEFVTAGQSLNNSVAEQSPIGRLYDLDGWVLLLGVGYEHNTSLHLADYRARWPGAGGYRCGTGDDNSGAGDVYCARGDTRAVCGHAVSSGIGADTIPAGGREIVLALAAATVGEIATLLALVYKYVFPERET